MVKVGDKFIAKSMVPGFSTITVIFRGVQLGVAHIPDFALYDLTTDLPGHPKSSTVTKDTIEISGYSLPHDAPR